MVIIPKCSDCIYFEGAARDFKKCTCKAFPDGIPNDIMEHGNKTNICGNNVGYQEDKENKAH